MQENTCLSFVVGVFALLAVVSDPRFNPETDRLSHALILVVGFDDWESLTTEVGNEINSALAKIQKNLGPERERKLFNADQTAELKAALENYTLRRERNSLRMVCKLVRQCVDAGVLKIEVCPYSNEMIRRSIVARAHPWASQFGRDNILVGTDDPSLTQTLPTFERIALATGKKRLQGRLGEQNE